MEGTTCEHLSSLQPIEADKYFCEECVKHGGHWVHLRVCQTCGVVLCCNSSPAQHASKHAAESGHPVIASAEPGENWAYCYVHDVAVYTD